jgi:predicted alpha/beta-hydrolase family hydrolase
MSREQGPDTGREVAIPVRDFTVSGTLFGAAPRATAVVLGHGAGGDRRTPFLVHLAQAIAASGRGVLLYNFPYTERGGKRPDAPEVLEMTARGAHDAARAAFSAARLVGGGKSMGGRIASQVAAAEDSAVDGLVFLGYPLHPPGKPDQLRDRHLPSVRAPMFFVQGTRDAFARWDLLEAVLRRLGSGATLHALDQADHSFAVPARTGRTRAQVEAEIRRVVPEWLDARGL